MSYKEQFIWEIRFKYTDCRKLMWLSSDVRRRAGN